MYVRSWSAGVVVAFSTLLASSRHAPAQNAPPQNAPPRKLPHYHVDVVPDSSPGGYGYDINDSGQVAYFGVSPGAKRWDPRDGVLTVAPGDSMPTGINKQGDMTVVHGSGPFLSSLWTERDGLIDLGTIGRQTWADDVNDHQAVVGWTERDTDAHERYAFRWTRDGGIQTLPNLPGGPREAGAAFDITNKGLIVGYSYGASGQEATRWVDGNAHGLGDFPGGHYESVAFAANERGQIVGAGFADGDASRAFLWSEDKGMIDLGALGADHHSVLRHQRRRNGRGLFGETAGRDGAGV